MKTKRVVVGTMAAALLSLTVCSLPMAYAAGDTVQISAGTAEAMPGEEFSVDVTMDIPSNGIQSCDFSVYFDNSILSVTSVTAGPLTETGADKADVSAGAMPVFDSVIHNDLGCVDLIWTTLLDDSQYWLKGDGVLCTITGTVAADAKEGAVAELQVAATGRETKPESGITNTNISAGYFDGTKVVKYSVEPVNGKVTVGTSGDVSKIKGDADLSGTVNLADAVAIVSWIADSARYPLEPQGLINADVIGGGDGINASDAIQIQKHLLDGTKFE